MAGQQVDILLGVFVHASALWNDIAYVLMVLFQSGFLVGNIRVTVKDIGAVFSIRSLFYIIRILKFGTIVCQDDRKVFPNGCARVNSGKRCKFVDGPELSFSLYAKKFSFCEI